MPRPRPCMRPDDRVWTTVQDDLGPLSLKLEQFLESDQGR